MNREAFFSHEGTSQGEAFAISVHGFFIILLIELLDDCFAVQKRYEDDGNAFGSLDNLKNLFESLKKHCPAFGYHLTKCTSFKEHFFEKVQPLLFTMKWK